MVLLPTNQLIQVCSVRKRAELTDHEKIVKGREMARHAHRGMSMGPYRAYHGFGSRLWRDRMSLMRVRVLFFGQLKEIVGEGQDEAELSEGARVEDLFERYGRRFPRLTEFRASIAASVNQEYAEWRAPLRAGDEVAFLPPVSGG